MKQNTKILRLIFCSSIMSGIASVAAIADTTTTRNLDCSSVSLNAAARDNANAQSWYYELSGICNLVDHTVTESATSTTSRNDVISAGFAKITARWNSDTGKALETIEFEGEMHGTVSSSFQCNTNPFETKQSCAVTGYEFSDDSLGYAAGYITQLRTPISGGLVDSVMAARLAENGASPPPPPPPPSGSPKIAIMAGIMLLDPIVLEGEDLVSKVTGQGQANPQNMAGFGSDWSNNGHLFWAPSGVGSLLTIPLESSGPSAYTVNVYLTKAPDFAEVRAYIRYGIEGGGSGDTDPVDLDAFATNVSGPTPITLDVPQTNGDMQLVIITMGKNAASTGLFTGIDRIRISRAP